MDQRWKNSYSSRPCGFIMYVSTKGNCEAIRIRPDKEIENKEKSDVDLELRNIELIRKTLTVLQNRDENS